MCGDCVAHPAQAAVGKDRRQHWFAARCGEIARVPKLEWTIAVMASADAIETPHLAMAMHYRPRRQL